MSNATAYAHSAYRRASYAVTPVKAVVMVYDEIITTMIKLDKSLLEQRHDEAFICVQKVTTLCRGLRVALDFKAGKQVAEQLDKTYGSIILALHRTFGRSTARQNYRKILTSLLALRNAWAEIDNLPPREPRLPN